MPTHAENRVLDYSAEQLFDLVADVNRYPEFLPWVTASRITQRRTNWFEADLIIGFKMIRETFTSQVTLHPHERIDVTYLEGPLRYLNNSWSFRDLPDGRCEVDFFIDFEFRSKMLQRLIGVVFHEAVRRMVGAFEARAKDLYGVPPRSPTASSTPAASTGH